MIKFKKRKVRNQTAVAMKQWMLWLSDYNSGLTVQEIAKKYKNPKTGKPYTISNIYFGFHRLEELTA